MSYKRDMEFFKQQQEQRRHRLALLIKITVFALAITILLTGVSVGITLLWGEPLPDRQEENDTPSGPRITGPEGGKITIALGDKPAYKSFVKVSDPDAKLTVDNSAVDTAKVGSYPVRYTATDTEGRQTSYTLTLVIAKDPSYTEERLMNLIAQKVEELKITESMSKTEKVRRVYNYVKDPTAGKYEANIYFSNVSNAPSQRAQNGIRTGWETDWVEEAIRTLSMGRMEGDCYSYYAVSKAFFEYLEIETIGIQRAAVPGMRGTHFWQAVNVGTKEDPEWYYYDATRLAGRFMTDGSQNSCLITEEKLMSYMSSEGETGFYTFDKSQYPNFPKIETTPIS